MKTATKLELVHDTIIKVIGDKPPLVEEGEYQFVYVKRWIGYIFNRPKIIMVFRIVTPCSSYGKKLYRCYNVKSINQKRGDFDVRRRGDLNYEYHNLFGCETSSRISMTPYKDKVIRANVRTVKKDYRQRQLPITMQYSVIGELICVEAGVTNL